MVNKCLTKMTSSKLNHSGMFFTLPCIDEAIKVDLRTVSMDVPPQEVLLCFNFLTYKNTRGMGISSKYALFLLECIVDPDPWLCDSECWCSRVLQGVQSSLVTDACGECEHEHTVAGSGTIHVHIMYTGKVEWYLPNLFVGFTQCCTCTWHTEKVW